MLSFAFYPRASWTLATAMKDHTTALYRLCQIPGVQMVAAQELLAEIGPRAAAFFSAEQFASWVGACPGCTESAGVCYSHRSAKGNRYLRRLLAQIAWAAMHVKETLFADLFRRLLPKIDGKGAARVRKEAGEGADNASSSRLLHAGKNGSQKVATEEAK